MGAVLHRVGQDEPAHPQGFHGAQGDRGVEPRADDSYQDRRAGVLEGVEGGDKELVEGHEGQLGGIEKEGLRRQGDPLRAEGPPLVEQAHQGLPQDDHGHRGRDDQEEGRLHAHTQGALEARVAGPLPPVARQHREGGEGEGRRHQAQGKLYQAGGEGHRRQAPLSGLGGQAGVQGHHRGRDQQAGGDRGVEAQDAAHARMGHVKRGAQAHVPQPRELQQHLPRGPHQDAHHQAGDPQGGREGQGADDDPQVVDRRRVGGEGDPPAGVEDAHQDGRQALQDDRRERQPDEEHPLRLLLRAEPHSQDGHQGPGEEHQEPHRRDEHQERQPQYRAGQVLQLALALAPLVPAGVLGEDGDQRGRDGAPDEEVVDHGGDAVGGVEDVGLGRDPKEGPDGLAADEPQQPADHVAQHDQHGGDGDPPPHRRPYRPYPGARSRLRRRFPPGQGGPAQAPSPVAPVGPPSPKARMRASRAVVERSGVRGSRTIRPPPARTTAASGRRDSSTAFASSGAPGRA